MTPKPFVRITLLCAALAASGALTSCALLVGGAVVGGSMVATDRRTSGTQLDDATIESKSSTKAGEILGDRGHVNITSYNRLVLVTGEVPTEADKAAIELAISRIEQVRSVVNELVIGAPSSMSTRSNDTLITSKVKASFVDAKDVQVNAYKVVTERNVVYLMGRVTEREATRAAEITRGVSGVQKVVKVFDIVTEGELAGTTQKPAAAAAPAAPASATKP